MARDDSPLKPLIEYINQVQAVMIYLGINGNWTLVPSMKYLFSHPKIFKKGDDKIRLYQISDIEQQFQKLKNEEEVWIDK